MSTRHWLALLVLIAVVSRADATGTLTIPNTFATQSGNVPVSQLDTNFTTVSTYINTREVTVGLIATRPAAGVSGRYFFATDVSGGTFYVDTGSAWQQLSPSLTSAAGDGSYSIRNLIGANAPAASTTQYNVSSDLVVLRNPTANATTVRVSSATLTNDTSSAGPTVNGRDQAGAFSANSWVHFYYIWNGTTLATLSSAAIPPTGPTLPTGYTHWAYVGAVRMNASSTLVSTRMRGSWANYEAQQFALTTGTATTETSVPLASYVAPNALMVHMRGEVTINGNANPQARVRYVTGQDYVTWNTLGNATGRTPMAFTIPNASQTVLYLVTNAANTFDLTVLGYSMPNGGD